VIDPGGRNRTHTECSSCNLTLANGETKTIDLNAVMQLDPLSCFDLQIYGIPAGWGAVATPSAIVTQAQDPTAVPRQSVSAWWRAASVPIGGRSGPAIVSVNVGAGRARR
jgi:hypothetical protein